jgi:hypothetical protein
MASLQGWGRQTWNSGAWNTFAPVSATGNGLSSALGSLSLTGDCNITLSGIGTTASLGTAVGTGVAEVTASGNNIAASLGTETVTGSSAVTATGIGLQAQQGDESATGVAQSGWGRGANQSTGTLIGWSDNLWNILESEYAFTGNSLTSSVGTSVATADVNITPTGIGLTSTLGQIGSMAEAGSLVATSSIGTFSISGDSQLTVVAASEPELDISIGTTAVTIGKTAFPSGNALTASEGTITAVGNAIVTPTGVSNTASLGTEVASTDVEVVGTGSLITRTVTVVSTDDGNKYFIDGVRQPTLELAEGNTYRFDQSDNSNDGHPLRFSETSNGTHGGGSEYTTGVTTNGTPGNAGAYTQIEVASGAPTLYYYCSIHSAMGGQANTPSSDANGYSATGLTSSIGQISFVGSVAVTISGNALTSSLGDESQSSVYSFPGVSATSDTGTLTVTGTSTLTLTGNSVTSSTGTLQGTFWSEVDDSNSDISWTEVHKAA